MKSFDINRFGQTLRWVVSVNMRKMLLWCIGSIVAVFLGEIAFQAMNNWDTPYWMLRNFSQFMSMLFVMVSLILISSITININEKRKREAFLMLPASNLEKYLSLAVYSTVICIACMFLSIVIGDSLRMAWYWVSGYAGSNGIAFIELGDGTVYHWWSSAVPLLIEDLTPSITNSFEVPTDLLTVEISFIAGFVLWTHSLYTLGGTLLRKYSFVITSVFIILCITLFVRMMFAFHVSIFHTRWDNGELIEYEIGTMSWILVIAFPLFSIANYWASYQIFKGFELITNKWTNYDFYKR